MSIPHEIIFISEVLAALAIIFGLLGSIYKFLIRPIIRHLREVREKLQKIDVIYLELRPNSGSSIKDAVNQIRNTVYTMDKRQRAWLSYEDHGIFETDENGKCIWTNRAYLKLLNVTFEEVEGFGWKNFIHPSNRESVYHEWNSAVQDKRDFKMNFKYLTANGQDLCCGCEAVAIKDHDGKLMGYVGIVTVQNGLDKCA